ncbi:hypothetical protein [Kribbella catacumbae]|uniref:hypothetical protein n=1 Tax=Kribbella catacumbae TaxID=460086 RepID=UPI0012FCDF88|nr:hypothetical protein [Kribbella catacumbae]
MELKPLLITRLCNASVWPILAGVIVIALRGDLPVVAVVGGALVCLVAAVYLGFLGWRLGVVCDAGGIDVHGLFRSRRIAKEEIVAITNFPAVRWKTRAGKARWTPIFAFANLGRVLPLVERHNEAAISILKDWFEDPKPQAPKKKQRQRRTR